MLLPEAAGNWNQYTRSHSSHLFSELKVAEKSDSKWQLSYLAFLRFLRIRTIGKGGAWSAVHSQYIT